MCVCVCVSDGAGRRSPDAALRSRGLTETLLQRHGVCFYDDTSVCVCVCLCVSVCVSECVCVCVCTGFCGLRDKICLITWV